MTYTTPKTSAQLPVAIIGAGLAGLTAASFFRRHNIPVLLYEADKQVGGLAQSFHDPDGFSYDFGAHFITNRLAAAVGVGAYCKTVRHYGEAVLLQGKSYRYPFGLLQVPRFLAGGVASRLKPVPEHRANRSAAEWFRSVYGKALADEVAIPLLEAWSGEKASDLAASVGNKLQNSIGETLWLKLAGRMSGRAVACGYSHEMPENANVWHVYPDGGAGLLCQRLAEGLEDSIRLETVVESIQVEEGRAVAVQVKGREQPVAAVVSTMPGRLLAKLVKGTDALKPLLQFRYRPMVFANMRFQGRGLLPDTVLWTPEQAFPFFRLTETALSMPWLAPSDKTLLTVDIGCQMNDAIWQMDEEQLGEFCLEHLQPIVPNARQRYLGCRVLKTPIAYPVFLNEYESDRQRFEHSTGVDGLYSIGRNGEFAHILMEDVYWRTLKKSRQILAALHPSSAVRQFVSHSI
jgi:protoporphyrinogen/coproporphyrinogen III oxidase